MPQLFVKRISKNHRHSLICFTCCADNQPLIVFKLLEPRLDISGTVAEAAGSFQPSVVDEKCCAQLGDQLFLGVRLRAEAGFRA